MKTTALFLAALAFSAGVAHAIMPVLSPDVTLVTDPNPGSIGYTEDSTDTYWYKYDSSTSGPQTGDYLVVVTDATGPDVTFAEEFQVPSTGEDDVTIDNDPFGGDYIDSGYYLSPTLIPLDDLNFGTGTNPVPPSTAGPDNSPYNALPNLDGSIPSYGFKSEFTPLPRSVWGGAALLVLMGVATGVRRRSQAAIR